MKKEFLIISLATSLLSCKNSDKKNQQAESIDSMANAKHLAVADTNATKSDQIQQVSNTLANSILGIWASVGEENASFVIEKNKIEYPDTFTSYTYSLVGDSIKINYDDYVGSYFVKTIGNDTLILRGNEEQVYYRFKK